MRGRSWSLSMYIIDVSLSLPGHKYIFYFLDLLKASCLKTTELTGVIRAVSRPDNSCSCNRCAEDNWNQRCIDKSKAQCRMTCVTC